MLFGVIQKSIMLKAFIPLILYVCCLCFTVSSKLSDVTKKPTIYYLHIKSDIRYRFATTSITSKVVNPGNGSREALFHVTLPNEAFITNFTLLINRQVFNGEVKEKEEAKQQYEDAKKLGQSAGIIKTKPRETNKFLLQVNVMPAGKVTFELKYQEFLRRVNGVYNHIVYINPGEVVEDFKVEVAIEDSRNLTKLQVSSQNEAMTNADVTAENNDTFIQKPSPNTAYIIYTPSKAYQESVAKDGLSRELVVQYDIDRDYNAGELLVVDGYFVHFFAPSGMTPLPMDVVFVLDTSGSMLGAKLQQLQTAMLNILDDIHPKDKFSVMIFNTTYIYWQMKLVTATQDNIQLAKDFVRGITAIGGTNINDALTDAVRLLNTHIDKERAPIIIFLTDGQPTSGIMDKDKILSNVRIENEADIPIFSLAFGSSADYDFVKKLAAQNYGIARRIYTDSDASLQISGFYGEVSTVTMKNISFDYIGEINETSLTRQTCNTYFEGSEIVVAGSMLNRSNSVTPIVTGLVNGGNTKNLVLQTEKNVSVDEMNLNLTQNSDFTTITEKMWAYLTIKELLKKRDALTEQDLKANLERQILDLSLKYNFVTPLTAMVVTLPKEFQAVQVDPESDEGSENSGLRTSHLSVQPGDGSTSEEPATTTTPKPQPKAKPKRKPMLLVKVPGISLPLCMDLLFENGKTYTLIEETSTGIRLTTKIQNRNPKNKNKKKTYTISQIVLTDKSNIARREVNLLKRVDGNAALMNITLGNLEIEVVQQGVGKKGFLQLLGYFTSRSPNDFKGIIGGFGKYTGRVMKRKLKKSKLTARLRLKNGKKKIKFWTTLLMDPSPFTDSCWNINKKIVRKLIKLSAFEIV